MGSQSRLGWGSGWGGQSQGVTCHHDGVKARAVGEGQDGVTGQGQDWGSELWVMVTVMGVKAGAVG